MFASQPCSERRQLNCHSNMMQFFHTLLAFLGVCESHQKSTLTSAIFSLRKNTGLDYHISHDQPLRLHCPSDRSRLLTTSFLPPVSWAT